MRPQSLSAWMESLGLNEVKASKSLGIARNTLRGYLAGKHPIPLYVELACEALSLRWQMLKPPKRTGAASNARPTHGRRDYERERLTPGACQTTEAGPEFTREGANLEV